MNTTRTVTERQEQLNGMALGGIGTGTVEIRPNGCLEDWEIFNLGQWACSDPEKNGKADLPDYDCDVLPFYIRTKAADGQPVVRKLCHSRKIGGFRSVSYSFMKNVEEIRWTPDFPRCCLEYADSRLPVRLKAEYIAPVVPRDYKTSSMPGFYIVFSAANESDQEQEVSLMGTLKNPVNRGLADRGLRNRIFAGENGTTLLMDSTASWEKEQSGSLALSAAGGEISWIVGDYTEYFGAYVLGGELGISEESCLFGFRNTGRLPNQGWEEKKESFLAVTDEELDAADTETLEKWLEDAKGLASGYRPWKRLTEVRPDILETAEGKREFLKVLLRQYREFEQEPFRGWGDGALCSSFRLQPGEEKQITFLVSWHFPHHVSIAGNYVGHQYSRWCGNALDAANYLLEHGQEIRNSARRLSRVLDTCSAPEYFSNPWSIQADTLLKCSWWAENGDFGIWEGLGSCGFHTTDITYYGSFLLMALFPQLQLRQMRMGLRFQREDGRVHHFFRPDFDHVDEGYDRVDMNQQFVLMVCRDYLWTGDRAYLEEMWEPVKKAMDSIEALDGNGDGLPDQDTRYNTYDAWRFRGTPAYIAGLWLGALLAAVRLADEMQDENRKTHWQALLEKGRASFENLWNGSYYSLWVDGEERDECLMTGQLDAQWYCHLLGIGSYVPADKEQKVLKQVWEHNYSEEGGLINASYPEGRIPTLYTYENVQVESNWSGIEYAMVSMYLENGYLKEAGELAANIDGRYMQAGRIFNHEECGGHYYRPMAAWTIMQSLAGLRLDVPRHRWTLRPCRQEIEVPWFTPEGYGIFRSDKEGMTISCEDGTASLAGFELAEGFHPENVCLDDRPLAYDRTQGGLQMKEICTLQPGQCLKIQGKFHAAQ